MGVTLATRGIVREQVFKRVSWVTSVCWARRGRPGWKRPATRLVFFVQRGEGADRPFYSPAATAGIQGVALTHVRGQKTSRVAGRFRQAALLLAQHTLVTQENTLKTCSLTITRVGQRYSHSLRATLREPQPLNLQDSWRRAVTQRPDYLEQKLNVEKQNVTLKYDFNQLFPELNVTGSYGRNAFNPSFGTALDNIRTDSKLLLFLRCGREHSPRQLRPSCQL